MSRKYDKLFVILLMLFLLASCSGKQPSDSMAKEIIHDFWQGNYEYTRTSYNKAGKNSQTVNEEMEGKLISDPYQQYEQARNISETQGITEQYWYMQDGKVVHNIKMSVEDTPARYMSFESDVKGSALYIKEDLSFDFNREENLSDRDVFVYRAQYGDELRVDYSHLPEEDRNGYTEITVPYIADIEYYIDFSAKEVVRIRIDGTESCRAAAIADLMFFGKSREEAEKEISENEFSDSYETIIDIKNYNGDIKIDLKDKNKKYG